jgi:hypothetical protein
MSRMKNQAMISFPLFVISNILLTHGALAASPSTTAMLAAVSKIPYQTDIVPVATQKAVTIKHHSFTTMSGWRTVIRKTGTTGCLKKSFDSKENVNKSRVPSPAF